MYHEGGQLMPPSDVLDISLPSTSTRLAALPLTLHTPAGTLRQRAHTWRSQWPAKQCDSLACYASSCLHPHLQENISSGRAQEGLTVYHEGGQLMPSSDAGQQAELLDRLGLGVKLLSGELCLGFRAWVYVFQGSWFRVEA